MVANMKAERIQVERHELDERTLVQIAIWSVPEPKKPSTHRYKYRLALVVDGACVLRYDNERGKGDHRHEGSREAPYVFTALAKLSEDFWNDVEN